MKHDYRKVYKPNYHIFNMIKIKCIICGETIKSPTVDQLCCNKKECKKKFNYNQIELWKHMECEKWKNTK